MVAKLPRVTNSQNIRGSDQRLKPAVAEHLHGGSFPAVFKRRALDRPFNALANSRRQRRQEEKSVQMRGQVVCSPARDGSNNPGRGDATSRQRALPQGKKRRERWQTESSGRGHFVKKKGCVPDVQSRTPSPSASTNAGAG